MTSLVRFAAAHGGWLLTILTLVMFVATVWTLRTRRSLGALRAGPLDPESPPSVRSTVLDQLHHLDRELSEPGRRALAARIVRIESGLGVGGGSSPEVLAAEFAADSSGHRISARLAAIESELGLRRPPAATTTPRPPENP